MSVKQRNLLMEIRQLLEIVYVKNTTEFIKFITEEIGIDNLNVMVKTSTDGGQNFLKVIINVFDPKNHYSSSEIYEDSGVKRCYILAIVELVSEDNSNLQKLLAPLKLEEVNFSLAFDLKCANSIFGLSNHSGKYACLYCEGECSLETEKLRTLGSIDLCYDQYVCDERKRLKMQEYKNVINPRLIYLQEDKETFLDHIVPPPELHIMMGVVDKLYTLLLCVWPAFQNWLKTHYILMRGYHGVGLDGNNANRFMSLLDFLERGVTITAAINILLIINCLRKFSLVKSAVFGLELGTDISVKIEDFKSSFFSLQLYTKDIFDYNLTVSWKIHILVCHILPFVEHNNISLGNYAEQCGEVVHHKFKKTWVNYKRTTGQKNYAEKLKSAVVNFNLSKQ